MNNYPLVSIVMPSYNQASYLEEAICSILDQHYPNLEFMILDGGSTDGSIEIIKKYADKLAYWQSKPDMGQTDALIQGFERATGEILGWVNSDDILLPNCLDHVASAYLSSPKVGIFYGYYFLIDEIGQIIECKRVPNNKVEWFAKRGHWVFNSIGTFFTRQAYFSIGGLNSDLNYVMDADLFIRMMNKGIKCKHINRYLAGFRRHNDAKTVKDARTSKTEHFSAANKYWPSEVAKGKRQMRWRYLYWVIQILNGNGMMFFDNIKYRRKHWYSL